MSVVNQDDMGHFIGMGRKLRRGLATHAAILALIAPAAAWAQTSPAPAPAPSEESSPAEASEGLADIVVTAQRRSQRLQDVPVAVSAFNADTLAQSGVTSVSEVPQLDPALNVTASSGVFLPFLRGVGNPSATAVGNEASVPVYIDDIYYTRLNFSDLELNNIERVEVLKGPQGTLFGRNSSGGLIQVFTGDPGQDPELRVTLGAANYETLSGKLYASTPITDRAAIDLSVSAFKQYDGWGNVVATGEDVGKARSINVRSKLVFEPTDTTRIRLIGFYTRMVTSQFNVYTLYRGTTNATNAFYGPPQVFGPPADFYDANGGFPVVARQRGWGGSLKIDQELGFADFTSITAYRKATDQLTAEGDATPLNFQTYILNGRDRQFSQELQLKSKPGDPLSWIIGAFYLNSRQGYNPTTVSGDSIDAILSIPGTTLDLIGMQTVKSYSGYGQATFPVVGDKTNITLGLRYTSDHVNGHGEQLLNIPGVGTAPIAPVYDRTFVFNKLTYKVSLDHHFTPDTMAYVTFSRGYKSGVFNTLPLSADPSRPEVVDAYEVGLKSDLFDKRLRLNAAVFQNDISNPQVQQIINGFIAFTNGGKARTRGAEFSAELLAATGLKLRFAGTYLDAKYVDFQNAPSVVPVVNGTCPAQDPALPNVPTNQGGNCPTVGRDASGNRLGQVPKWRFNGGVNYAIDTSSGNFVADVNAAYTGSFFWQPDNVLKQSKYVLLNASLTYQLPDNDRWSLRIWGKNLTKVKYYVQQLQNDSPTGSLAAAGAPLTFGGEITYKF